MFGKPQTLRQKNAEERQCLCGKKFISSACCTMPPTFPPTASPVSQWALPITKDIRTGESVSVVGVEMAGWVGGKETGCQLQKKNTFLLISDTKWQTGRKCTEYVHLGFGKLMSRQEHPGTTPTTKLLWDDRSQVELLNCLQMQALRETFNELKNPLC